MLFAVLLLWTWALPPFSRLGLSSLSSTLFSEFNLAAPVSSNHCANLWDEDSTASLSLDFERRVQKLWDRQINSKEHPGGPLVIVFWHIAKTGGTTIRSFFGSLPKNTSKGNYHSIRVRLALKPGDFSRASHAIHHHLKSDSDNDRSIGVKRGKSKVLFVEFHGQGFDANQWVEESKVWRQMAERGGSRLFTFTLWRHPMDHAVSYYHYLVNRSDPMEEGFPDSFISSRQCHTFVSTAKREYYGGNKASIEQGKHRRDWQVSTHGVSPCHLRVYEQLFSQLDWIGTTETIDRATIPLLGRIVAPYVWKDSARMGRAHDMLQNASIVPHANIGTYRHQQRLKFLDDSGDSAPETFVVDATLRERIEHVDACQDFAIWKKATAIIEKFT